MGTKPLSFVTGAGGYPDAEDQTASVLGTKRVDRHTYRAPHFLMHSSCSDVS